MNFSQQKVKRRDWTRVRLKVLWKIWLQMMRLVCYYTHIHLCLTCWKPSS